MPAAGWRKHSRDPALVERDLERYRARHPKLFAWLECPEDPRRSETRFAGEVMLEISQGRPVPRFALERALETLAILAKG